MHMYLCVYMKSCHRAQKVNPTDPGCDPQTAMEG